MEKVKRLVGEMSLRRWNFYPCFIEVLNKLHHQSEKDSDYMKFRPVFTWMLTLEEIDVDKKYLNQDNGEAKNESPIETALSLQSPEACFFTDILPTLLGHSKEPSRYFPFIRKHQRERGHLQSKSWPKEYLEFLVELGVDIQPNLYGAHEKLSEIQETQRGLYAIADKISNSVPLNEILSKDSHSRVLSAYDRHGRKLLFLCALYDRSDILNWVIESDEEQLDQLFLRKDWEGRTVEELAKLSGSSCVCDAVAKFKLVYSQQVSAAIVVQRLWRGWVVRKQYRKVIQERVKVRMKFLLV